MAAEADFSKSVQSVLEARCIDCHGSKKQKGDLRLDSLKDALSALKPGESGESELFKRIVLPSDHEDIMPPKGEPLTKEQIESIKTWIDGGATGCYPFSGLGVVGNLYFRTPYSTISDVFV